VPAFRSKLQELLDNDDARQKLLDELDLATGEGNGE
jgi:type VI secretion system protein ImpB